MLRSPLFSLWGLCLCVVTLAAPLLTLSRVIAPYALHRTYVFADGQLAARLPSGELVTGRALVGARFTLDGSRGALVRVDRVRDDPLMPGSPIPYYEVSRLNSNNRWVPYCAPDVNGDRLAVALPGRWTGDAASFAMNPASVTLTCTAGANGKCVRMGYLPWSWTADGEPLQPYFEACVRMIRADYCGDGSTFTRDGTAIAWIDRARLHRDWSHRHDLSFEAVWGPRGAVCLRRVRHDSLISTDSLLQQCPRLAERVGATCRADLLTSDADRDALLVNRSPDRV